MFWSEICYIIIGQGHRVGKGKMLYEKSLKQLNVVFPKLNIKPPAKKAIIRQLIQQINVPYLTSADFQLLKDKQTASKPLAKLATLIQTWIRVLENNEKARQQQQSFQAGPGNSEKIQWLQEALLEAEQVSNAEEFIMFITVKGEELYRGKGREKSIKDYRDTEIPKQREFYNTISPIGEEQYFHLLQQVLEKLGILEQVVKNQIVNMDYLVDLHNMIEAEDIFKKKDNIFHKVINYNLIRTMNFAAQVEADRKTVYYYEQELTFAVARCYYLLYLAQKDLNNYHSEAFLDQLESFLCYKRQSIFPKLYNNIITEPLILMEEKRKQFIELKFPQQELSPTEIASTNSKITNLHQFLLKNNGKLLNEQQFLEVYPEIQNLLIQTSKHLKIDKANEQYKENKAHLIKYEKQVLELFANQVGQIDKKSNSRKILGEANSRLSGKSHGFDRSQRSDRKNDNNSSRNTRKVGGSSIKEPKQNIQSLDLGTDIFLDYLPQSPPPERKQKIQALTRNEEQFEKQCRDYLQKIKPSFGQILDDAQNFHPEELYILEEAGSFNTSKSKEKQILSLINRNLIKPQITEQNFHKIFQPTMRFNVLKLLTQKLVQLAYKNSKIIDSPTFEDLPQNIKQFVQLRSAFLKVVNKQLDKITGIADIIAKLPFQSKYDICRYESYDIFLKVLLAIKQAKSYELSFRDEKKISRETSLFIQNKIYSPFISSLIQLLPPPYHEPNQIVGALDELEFFRDFLYKTEEIIEEALQNLKEKTREQIEFQKRDLARILGNWVGDANQKLKEKKELFIYQAAEMQLKKLNEVIRVCNNERSGDIKDPTARRLVALIVSEL